jgi:DNA-binding transcriptional LysR family regulator
MDLVDLKIFVSVVEQGGIAKAGRLLHRVQSNITTRVKQLEQSVGAELFIRDKRRVYLSPKGEQLLRYAYRILTLSEEAKASVANAAPSGTLRLGALESTSASRLPTILAAYHKAYPDVRVELTTGTNDQLITAVVNRQLDAAFVVETSPSSDLGSIPLFAERLVVIASRQHPHIRRPKDVEGDSIIAFPTGCAYRRVLQRWLGRDNLATVRVLELSSYHAIVACVAAGTGIALVPESVLDTVVHDAISRYPIPKVYGSVTTPFIWRRDGGHSAVVGALCELLRARTAPSVKRPRLTFRRSQHSLMD